jgi:PAS domain S-box-containing protein
MALGVTALGLLGRRALAPVLGDYGLYTVLFPGIVFLAFYVGLGPAVVASVLTGLGVVYWFVPGPLAIVDSAHVAGRALSFLAASACIAVVGELSRRSRTQLQYTQKLFQTFLDNSPGPEYLKDEDGTYVYVNNTTRELWGKEVIGKTDADLVPARCVDQWRSNDLQVLKENKAAEFIENTDGPHGERTWLSVKFPVTDAAGRKLLGGKSFDVTEQKRAEAEIARLQQENARRVAAELEAMVRLQDVGNHCVRPGSDLQGTLQAIVDAAIFLMGAEKGNLQLLDPSSGTLMLAAHRGFEDPFLRFFAVVKDEISVCGAVMRTRERIVVEDITSSEIFAGKPSRKVMLDAGVRAVQSTPLVSSTGKLLGITSTHFGQPHRPGERELRLMDLLARQAADYLERKQGEDELRISEERLRLAQMSGNVGVWDWDVKANQVRWTPELEAMFGLDPDTIQTYDDFSRRVHPDDLEMVERKRDEALRKHEPFELDFRIMHASGETRWVVAKGRGFYDDSGQLVRVLGNNIDITERKQAEEEIRAASELLRRFLDAVPSGLARCSRDLRYVTVNPAFARLTGLPAEHIVGRPIVDVMGAEAWEKIKPYVERVLRGERVEYEMARPFPAGIPYVHVGYTPEQDASGEVVGWVASVTDITEFSRVEKQLAKVEKLAAAGQLAASLAHEINNPLSAVTNVLYLLTTGSNLDERARRLADTGANELERVARIVRQSLAYYRVGTTAKAVDLGASVEESLQIFGDKFRRAGVDVRKKITPNTLMMGFPDEIRQVVDNLLLNALEATPSGGRLSVGVRWSRDWKKKEGEGGVRLTIADSGQGIPKEQLAKIYEPFFTTKAERGTGLGLWVVQGIVAKHGGSMKIRSVTRDGKSGSVFSILWPSHRSGRGEEGPERSESAA